MKKILFLLLSLITVGIYAQPGGGVFTTRQDTTLKGVVRDSLANRIAYYNVLQFGAIGDGVTDVTTSFQNALNALPDGGTLVVPEGRYKIKGDLTPNIGTTIIGHSQNETYAQGGTVFEFDSTAGFRLTQGRVTLKDFSIVTADTAIVISSIQNRVEDVEIMGGIGITKIGVSMQSAIYNVLDGVKANQCSTGLQIGVRNVASETQLKIISNSVFIVNITTGILIN